MLARLNFEDSRYAARLLPIVVALSFAACAPAPYYVDNDEDYADMEPPEATAEQLPPAPGPHYVWVPGYWYWTGLGYVWHAGYYTVPPAPGHVWVRSGWVHHHNRYRFVPGRWSRPDRMPQHRYVPNRRPPPVRR